MSKHEIKIPYVFGYKKHIHSTYRRIDIWLGLFFMSYYSHVFGLSGKLNSFTYFDKSGFELHIRKDGWIVLGLGIPHTRVSIWKLKRLLKKATPSMIISTKNNLNKLLQKADHG